MPENEFHTCQFWTNLNLCIFKLNILLWRQMMKGFIPPTFNIPPWLPLIQEVKSFLHHFHNQYLVRVWKTCQVFHTTCFISSIIHIDSSHVRGRITYRYLQYLQGHIGKLGGLYTGMVFLCLWKSPINVDPFPILWLRP